LVFVAFPLSMQH